jgi:hypothetical protein
MTFTLHLGVIEVPYTNTEVGPNLKTLATPRGRQTIAKAKVPDDISTGDVAEILEDKYHVMELFVEELGLDTILKALDHSMAEGMANIIMGAPADLDITYEAMQELEAAFRIFIDQRELDGVVPGVPTLAALKGVNHRLKHPYAKGNPERPSFKDTGLYQAAFKAWSDR